MKRFCYPAIFHPEEVGYSVSVPDFEKVGCGCFTCGDTFEHAYSMVIEAVGLCIDTLSDDGTTLPEATLPDLLIKDSSDFIVMIEIEQ